MILNKEIKFIGCIVFLFLTGIIACQDSIKKKQPVTTEKKYAITDVVLHDLNDQPVNLEQFKGKTVFINFWATWCKPCIREMPSIKNAMVKLSQHGVVFLLASDETTDQIKEFKNEHNYDFNYFRVINMEELNVQALPTTFIFTPSGEMAFQEMGFRKWDDTANIKMILKINDQK